MSRKNNHTDQAFRQHLRRHQEAPPETVWSGISEVLDQDRRKSRIIWIRRIAASLALLIATGGVLLLVQRSPQVQQNAQSVYTETMPSETATIEQATIGTEPIQTRPAETALSETTSSETGSSEPAALDTRQYTQVASAPIPRQESPGRIKGKNIHRLPGNEPEPGTLLAMRSPQTTPVIEEEGIDVFAEFGEEGFSSYDKWAIGGQVSPMYSYRNLDAASNASSANGYFNDVEKGIVSYAGGLNLNFSPAKRLSLQSGLYYSRMGMTVGNTYLASAEYMPSYANSQIVQQATDNSSGQIEIGGHKSNKMLFGNSRETAADASASYQNTVSATDGSQGELLQHFEYLEIPVILRYRVVDRRLGFNLLGGMSTNFLVGSNAYYQEGSNREYIGTTQDLKTVNYSSVLGVGLQYSLKPNFHINMEPTFRYYLNSINAGSSIGSHPYSLGFFTGISYSF